MRVLFTMRCSETKINANLIFIRAVTEGGVLVPGHHQKNVEQLWAPLKILQITINIDNFQKN